MSRGFFLIVLLLCAQGAFSQGVVLDERDAEAWLPRQEVRGHVEGAEAAGTLYLNGEGMPFEPAAGKFVVPVTLVEGINEIVACGASGACSDTVRWELRLRLRPEATAYATVENGTIVLHARIEDSPGGPVVSYDWQIDPENPGRASLGSSTDSVAYVQFPGGAPEGEYYFNLTVVDSTGRTGRARTFVTLDSTGVRPFDIRNDHARWVDEAVLYEITPYTFVNNGTLNDIRARLGELVDLGITALWLQPVFETAHGGQGYDIIDYFKMRPDYGTEDDLRRLVDEAHERGLRVILDFVPNHTSIQHRYAKHASEHGSASRYYRFYQRDRVDGAAYSQHYNRRTLGRMDFVYYFWNDLVNLNYNNPEVRRWMIEAGRRWVEDFDIDGYRIDAVWGTSARTPAAMKEWRLALKRIKPEVLLLGEDKATWPESFEERFDVAFDWYPEEGWVSHWTWQTSYSESRSNTIFNYADQDSRSHLLRQALTNRGQGWHPDAKVLRFMENNDTFRFIQHHGAATTKMAAGLLLSLPGLPLIYNGQEKGIGGHPYSTGRIYDRGRTLRSQTTHGLFDLYERLIEIRKTHPALYSDNFQEVVVAPDVVAKRVFAYRRWEGPENIIGVINMSSGALSARLSIEGPELVEGRTYYLTDLVTGDFFELTDLDSVAVTMPATTTRILILSDEVVQVSVSPRATDLPNSMLLGQNYPNPFNASTTIEFMLPQAGHVRLSVYDVLGRRVATLVNETLPAGIHEADFDAGALPSGTYVYRVEHDGKAAVRTMILLK